MKIKVKRAITIVSVKNHPSVAVKEHVRMEVYA